MTATEHFEAMTPENKILSLRADNVIMEEKIDLVCEQLNFLVSVTCELENLHLVKGCEFASMLEGLHAQLKTTG